MKPIVVIAIPCYNEQESISSLLDSFQRMLSVYAGMYDFELLLIDDGSTDATLERALPHKDLLPLRILRHENNRGLSAGIETAFQYFYDLTGGDNPPSVLGLLDGDNSHNPFLIPQMLEKVFSGYDVVIASRFQAGSRVTGLSFFRRALTAGMAVLFLLLRRIPGVRDYSCGYRLYSEDIVKRLKEEYEERLTTEKSFACMAQLLLRCYKVGAVCGEVPVVLRYELKQSESKMRILQTIRGTLRVLWRGE